MLRSCLFELLLSVWHPEGASKDNIKQVSSHMSVNKFLTKQTAEHKMLQVQGGNSVNYWVSTVDARNREYGQLMRKFAGEVPCSLVTKPSSA